MNHNHAELRQALQPLPPMGERTTSLQLVRDLLADYDQLQAALPQLRELIFKARKQGNWDAVARYLGDALALIAKLEVAP